CERNSSDCYWTRDVRIVFHTPEGPGPTRRRQSSIQLDTSSLSLSTPSQHLETPSVEHDGFHTEYPTPEPDLASIRPVDHTSPSQTEQFTDWATLEASELVQSALRTQLEVELMHNYLTEVAPWFDAHSAQQHYSRASVARMKRCPPWRAAALAISAKNIELRERRALSSGPESLPLHLYQLAVRLAIESMSGKYEVVGTLSGCVLLCVYEMMTVTYTDWRRHVEGCASIYTHNRWNGNTGGLISGSFWDYARIDIWAAFSASTKTILPPATYFDHPETIVALRDIDEDLHAQIAIWLTARVVNLVAENLPASQSHDYLSLSAAMRTWEDMGAEATRPVVERAANIEADHPFPQILFSTHSSTIGHTQFHTAMCLLLEYEMAQPGADLVSLKDLAYEHALKCAGIIETNNHTACLVNSLQPAYVAGKHMKKKYEKFAVLELLAQIQKKTGWKCEWRSDGLREFWSLC
ncbi:hypothetical protein HII31_05013, partial [Pseudocercospora fuligena]